MTTAAGNTKTVKGSKKYLSGTASMPWFTFICPSLVNEILYLEDLSPARLTHAKGKIKDLNPDLLFLLPHPADSYSSMLKKIFFFKVLGFKKNFYGWNVWGDYAFGKKIQYELGLFGHKIFGPLRAIKEYHAFKNIDDSVVEFPLAISHDAEIWADEVINSIAPEHKIIALSIGAVQPHKKWPILNYIGLIEALNKHTSCFFILLGTNNDLEIGLVLENSIQHNIENLIGKTSVEQIAALLKRVDLLIGNDGGSMHIGAAVKCASVSIIPGLEYPGSVEPWGYSEYAVRHPVVCAPCYSMNHCPLQHNSCMVDLPISQVLQASLRALENINTAEFAT